MNKAVKTFIDEMNNASESLGLKDSHWINPSGLRTFGSYSQSTCRDLCLLGSYAYNNETIRNIWNQRTHQLTWHRGGEILKNIVSSMKYEYFDNSEYEILGAKTGGGDGHHALVTVAEINNRMVCGAISGTSTPDRRFVAMKELFDCLSNKRSSVDASKCAFAIDIESNDVLYNKNGYERIIPMSTTKLLTVLTTLKYCKDLNKSVIIIDEDMDEELCIVPSCIFQPGDIVTLEELLYAALLPSSNQAANIIARVAGETIISSNSREINNQDS